MHKTQPPPGHRTAKISIQFLWIISLILLLPACNELSYSTNKTSHRPTTARSSHNNGSAISNSETSTPANTEAEVLTENNLESEAPNTTVLAPEIATIMVLGQNFGQKFQTNNDSDTILAINQEMDSINQWAEAELINLSSCVQGLKGNLSTGRAGRDFLATYGRLPRTPATIRAVTDLASLDNDRAPSSQKFLRLSHGVTDRLLANAYSQTGRPYQPGGHSPQTGFDDPGFINWIYAQESVRLPQGIKAQVAGGKAVAKDDLRPGDILVFKRFENEGSYDDYLVGLYSGNGNFIYASSKLRVITETAAFGSEFGPFYIGGRRYFDDPAAAPLSDNLKVAAANGAVKTALSELGDNVPKPANIYGSKSVKKSKATVKKGKKYSKNLKSSKSSKSSKKAAKPILKKGKSKLR